MIVSSAARPDPEVTGRRLPTGGRILARPAVDRFADQVGVAGVPAVLLDQVAHQAAQVRVLPLVVGGVDRLVEAPVGERLAQPLAGALDRAVVKGVELLGGVVGRR